MIKKLLFMVLPIITLLHGGTTYADDITCESDEILDNGVCVPVCNANTTNFEYTDPDTGTTTCIKNKFSVTTTDDTDKFVFHMHARGLFYVDWGDGTVEKIDRTNVANNSYAEYSHDYSTTDSYIIKFGGERPIGYYSTDNTTRSSLGFSKTTNATPTKVKRISGSLGKLLPIIGTSDASYPRFINAFNGCTNLEDPIPNTLFSGLSIPASGMFKGTFKGCSKITSIPDDLFGDITGLVKTGIFQETFSDCTGLTRIPPNLFHNFTGTATNAFQQTFYNCKGLTGIIPGNLFAGISGAPANNMFYQTFYNCTGLTGTIPGNLFAGISGAPAGGMFYQTFYGCSGLTGIGTYTENGQTLSLFSKINGAPQGYMYYSTFSGCSGLTGSIPSGLFGTFNDKPAASMFRETFLGCKNLTGSIPGNLFAGISGAPAGTMFFQTFSGCKGLTGEIPGNLFAGITGAPATNMFNGTFTGCSGLTGQIPANLFAGISGAPAGNMFYRTFLNCSGLTGQIPTNLFCYDPDNNICISGAVTGSMFSAVFSGCSEIDGFIYPDGKTTTYIPPTFFEHLTTNDSSSVQMFYNTKITTKCPEGMYKYITGFESWFGGKVSCEYCPTDTPLSPVGSTSINQCYKKINLRWYDGDTELTVQPAAQSCVYGEKITLPDTIPTKPGYTFAGWQLRGTN